MDVSYKIHESLMRGVTVHSVGVLEQRGRGGCSGYSGPATQHRGHQNRLPRALVTSSRGERAQLRHGTLE